jgi:hypothetical protein
MLPSLYNRHWDWLFLNFSSLRTLCTGVHSDSEVRSSTRVHNAALCCSTRPYLQIRINHCLFPDKKKYLKCALTIENDVNDF